MRKIIPYLVLGFIQPWIFAQTQGFQPEVLRANVINGITSSAFIVDNRSQIFQEASHSFCATGTGTWSVQIQYADGSTSGPWHNFTDAGSLVINTSSSCTGIGTGYHDYIRFTITGLATVNYAGTKYIWLGGLGSLTPLGNYLLSGNNLADVNSASASRTNLGLGTAATQASSFFLQSANNLSDLTSAALARTNLGLSQSVIAALWTGTGCSTATNALLVNGNCGFGLPSGAQTKYLQLTPNSGSAPSYQWSPLNSVNPGDYNYSVTPTSPSTLVGAGGSQVVTVPVCPLGVYTSGTWSTVYLTAGSGGTAEAVTPSGGTCSAATLGTGGGTIIVSPANNHGSGYGVTSATAGFQEAALAQQGIAIAFSGTVTWQTGVTLPGGHPGIIGIGPNAYISLAYNAGDGIDFPSGGMPTRFANFSISPFSGVATSGVCINNTSNLASMWIEDVNVGLNARDCYIGVQSASQLYAKNVYEWAQYRGFQAANEIHFDTVHVSSSSTTGTVIANSAALYMTLQTGGVAKAFSHDAGVFTNCIVADASANPVNELSLSDLYCDHFMNYGIYTPSSSNQVQGWQITNFRIEDNSGNNNGICFGFGASVTNISISNGQCGYWSGGVVLSGSSYVNMTGLSVYPKGNTSSGPYGQGPQAISLDTSANHIKIGHSLIGVGPENSGTISKYGIVDNAASSGSFNVDVFSNNIQGSSGNVVFFNNGAGVDWNVWSNTGVDDVWPTVSSASAGGTINVGFGNWYTKAYITGTTPVSTINMNGAPPQSGRSITYVKTDTGTLTIGGSAQIPGTYTLGQHSLVTLTYDSTANIWSGTQAIFGAGTGTVTSVATSCGVTGGTITSTGTISGSELVNAQSGTTYTIQATDCQKLVTVTNSSAIAVTVPTATGSFAAGFKFSVKNSGSGTATLTPATGTIGGSGSLALTTGQGCDITSDGTNWQTQCGSGTGSVGFNGTVNQSLGTGSSPLTETWTVGTGGVTANTLVQTDSSNQSKIVAATSGAYGIAMSTVSATGSVEVARYGTAYCVADTGGAIAGDLVVIGTGTVIDCKDSGQTASSAIPITSRIIGVFRSNATAGNLALVELTPAHFGTLVTGSLSPAACAALSPSSGTTYTPTISATSLVTCWQITFSGGITINLPTPTAGVDAFLEIDLVATSGSVTWGGATYSGAAQPTTVSSGAITKFFFNSYNTLQSAWTAVVTSASCAGPTAPAILELDSTRCTVGITPGTGVAAALAIATNVSGGLCTVGGSGCGATTINPTANTGTWAPLGDFSLNSSTNWNSTTNEQINEVELYAPTNINNVGLYVGTGGAGSHCVITIRSATGSLLYTSSVGTPTASSTAISMTIVGGLLPAGTYLVGFSNDSTTPTYAEYARNIFSIGAAVWSLQTGHFRTGYCANPVSWSGGAPTINANCGTINTNPAQAPNLLFWQ